MNGTMKALIFKDKGHVELEERSIPEYGDDGILVKVAYAGICGSDIHAYTKGGIAGGIWLPDAQFGHEFSGTIVEVGKNVKDLKVGDRVWVDPNENPDTAHSCMCGGFAEYAVSQRAVKGETVFVLPDSLSFKDAALIEPAGVGVRTKNRGRVKPGDKIIMYGAGPIGLMAYAAMIHQGIKDIIVAEVLPSRVEAARRFGCDVVNNAEEDLYAYARERFGIKGNFSNPDAAHVDVVLDMAGTSQIIEEFIANSCPGARLSTLSIDATPVTFDGNVLMSKELELVGSQGYSTEDIEEVIQVLDANTCSISDVVTAVFSLEDFKAAFETASDRDKGLKVLFKISGE